MDARHDVLLLYELRHPEGVDHVLRRHAQHDRTVDGETQDVGRLVAVPGVAVAPEELLRGHLDAQRVRALGVVFGEDDRADDRDRGDEERRHGRPEDLEAGVAVDGRTVGVVVRFRAELPHREDADRGHDREDEDADARHEPEDEVDPVGLFRGRRRQPGHEKSHRGRHCGGGKSDCNQAHEHSPAHDREPTESAGKTPAPNKRHKPFTKGCFSRNRPGYPAACGPHHQKSPERRTTWESE